MQNSLGKARLGNEVWSWSGDSPTPDLGLGTHTFRQGCRARKLNNLDEMDQFIKIHKLPKLTEGELEYSTTIKEVEFIVWNKKWSGPDGITGKCY